MRAHRIPAPWIFVILTLVLYGFTLNHELVFDDYPYLIENPLVKDTRSLWFMGDFHAFANHSKSLGLDPDLSTNFILRPFAYLTFHLNWLVGGMNPAGYRVVNIAVHFANALLLLALVRRLLRHAHAGGKTAGSVEFTAMTASLLFLVHPLQIESVTYVVQRFTSLGTLFYLAVILAFVNARTAEDAAGFRRWRRWSVAALLAGTFTKEFLFTAPFMIVLLDWIFFHAPLRGAVRRALPWCATLPIIPVLIVLISTAQNDGAATFSNALNVAGTKNARPDYAWIYTLTQPGIVLDYIRLIFIPIGLNIDPDPPFITSLADWRVLGPLAAIFALLAAAIRWHTARREDSRRALVLCGVLWFFLTISVDSSFVPLPDLMAEHRTYLPSVGMFLSVACLADMARTSREAHRNGLRQAVSVCVGIAVVLLSAATILRNQVFGANLSLWTDTTAKSPNKWRPWKNLGVAYTKSNQHGRAADAFRRATEISPGVLDGWFGLANSLIGCGRSWEGLKAAEEGLKVREDAGLHYFRGVALRELGRDEAAIAALLRALEVNSRHGPSHGVLALLFIKHGDFSRAQTHARLAAQNGGLNDAMKRMIEDVEATTRVRAALPPGS